jgi:DNA modification methylase
LGFDFYGCELDKDYFDAAEGRFQRHISQPTFWETEKVKAEQTSLFANA